MSVPTSKENLTRINNMVESLMEVLPNLQYRWSCESKYEDINDYAKVIKEHLPKDIQMTKMSKRPFGFHFTIGTEAEYQVKANSRQVAWCRIK